MGISVLLAERFLDCNISSLISNPSRILVPYSQIIQSTVSRWNRESHPPLSVTEAINVMRSGVQVKEEKWWSKASQLCDRGSASHVCGEVFKMAVDSKNREAFIITLHTDHTFVVLIDENGDQLVLNSHLFLKESSLSFQEAVDASSSGASVFFAPESGKSYCTSCWNLILNIFMLKQVLVR